MRAATIATVEALAEHFQVAPDAIARLAAAGKLPHPGNGRALLVVLPGGQVTPPVPRSQVEERTPPSGSARERADRRGWRLIK